ncbi:ragulator complex protein LAMTOR5 isoform X1 [Balaenoptera acutorostrata]|uniref:Ragulator complex protein LAMTOR5 isoform X1 n=1 Tax=Balaenoptera acutorostrata TaxID=9767 RepID=A0ABM3RZR7_BALAC|nr:ragulator complex protein LAMTOR5 isoform X1 [Balaenoptera acutorostrata]
MSSWTQREGCAAKFVPLEAPFLPTARSRHVTDRGAPETSGEEGGDSRRDGGNLRAALGGHNEESIHCWSPVHRFTRTQFGLNIMIQKHDGITVAVHKMAS